MPQKTQTDDYNTKQLDNVKKYNVFDPEKHQDTSLMEAEDKTPLTVQERRQTVQVYTLFKEKAQWGEFYKMYGLVLFLLGGFFLVVPFYNVIC